MPYPSISRKCEANLESIMLDQFTLMRKTILSFKFFPQILAQTILGTETITFAKLLMRKLS